MIRGRWRETTSPAPSAKSRPAARRPGSHSHNKDDAPKDRSAAVRRQRQIVVQARSASPPPSPAPARPLSADRPASTHTARTPPGAIRGCANSATSAESGVLQRRRPIRPDPQVLIPPVQILIQRTVNRKPLQQPPLRPPERVKLAPPCRPAPQKLAVQDLQEQPFQPRHALDSRQTQPRATPRSGPPPTAATVAPSTSPRTPAPPQYRDR